MAKLKAGYIKCPYCNQQFSKIQWCADHIKEKHPEKAKEQGLNPVEVTEQYIRRRIREPEKFDRDSFRTIVFDKGIRAVVGCPKGQFEKGKCKVGTKVQTLLFPKDQYTKESAETWIQKHPKIRAKRKK